jgi:hypothetical protein
MSMDARQQPAWLAQFAQWITAQGGTVQDHRSPTGKPSFLGGAPGRIEATRQTLRAASHNAEFKRLVANGDKLRDTRNFSEAEGEYRLALAIFPLHGSYRVQYAHCLKEQSKHEAALVQYCYALGLGAPRHDVEEHLLFAAGRAKIGVDSTHVEKVVAAWNKAERTGDDWDAPPTAQDFLDFAELFWGNANALTDAFVLPYLLACHTRKALFLKFLGAPDTLRHNRRLFVMLNQNGSTHV